MPRRCARKNPDRKFYRGLWKKFVAEARPAPNPVLSFAAQEKC